MGYLYKSSTAIDVLPYDTGNSVIDKQPLFRGDNPLELKQSGIIDAWVDFDI